MKFLFLAKNVENVRIELELAKYKFPQKIELHTKLYGKLAASLKEGKEGERLYQELYKSINHTRSEYLEFYSKSINTFLKYENEIISYIKNMLKSYYLYQTTRIKAQNFELESKI